jgi:hypothetical protein
MEEGLDHSEISLIRRAIEAAGKDPGDAAVWAKYEDSYRRLLTRLRFTESEPATKVLQ